MLRFAAGRPHVLLLDVPGGTGARLVAERELRRRGWPCAASPADADLVVVTGPVGDRLRPFRDRLWQQVPAPGVCVPLAGADDVAGALDTAWTRLAGGGDRTGSPDDDQDREGGDAAADESDEMEMPGGLSMADRGPDRDGLMLDQLHVPLGPLLPDWPAGLVVHTTLQGDVIQEAQTEILADGPGEAFWAEPWRGAAAGEAVTAGEGARHRAGSQLDSLGRLLAVAGWDDAALRARWLRDDVLGGARTEQVMPRLRRFASRLRGSRTLRWLTDRLGVLSAADADAAGVVGPARRATRSGGDVSARWQEWLAEVEQTLPDIDATGPLRGIDEGGSGAPLGDGECNAALLAVLPGLLDGVELATARLIVASLDPDLAELGAPKVTEAADG